jgi:hypothetical protein
MNMGRGIRWRIFTTIWLEARWRTTVVPNGSASSVVNRQKLVIERLSGDAKESPSNRRAFDMLAETNCPDSERGRNLSGPQRAKSAKISHNRPLQV